jgi:hypothetical protein
MTPGPDGRTLDQLDVSDLRREDGGAVTVRDIVVGDDGQGNAVLNFPGGETLRLLGVDPADVAQGGQLYRMGVPCFVEGTAIAVPGGTRPVEAIAAGDLVLTSGGAAVPVVWRGARAVSAADLAREPRFRPIRIAAGAVGNAEPFWLSPQHCIALTLGRRGKVLIRARHLAEARPDLAEAVWPGPARPAGADRAGNGADAGVVYHHLLLPAHAILAAAGGAEVESLYPGSFAIAGFGAGERAAICDALAAAGVSITGAAQPSEVAAAYGPPALPILPRRLVLALLARFDARGRGVGRHGMPARGKRGQAGRGAAKIPSLAAAKGPRRAMRDLDHIPGGGRNAARPRPVPAGT